MDVEVIINIKFLLLIHRTPRLARNVDIKMDETEVQSEQEQEPEVLAEWDPGSSDHDALDLFFASVCQSTKRLPKKYQSQIKREVLDTLLRIEEQYEADAGETKMDVSKVF